MIIYKITNKVNGKIYVGQTTRSLEERWYGHCSTANQHGILGKALIKYGKENFRQEILEYVLDEHKLDDRERYWIQFYNCLCPKGYNLESGGNQNKRVSIETRKRMSESKLGKKYGHRRQGSGDNISLGKGSKEFIVINNLTNEIVGTWFNKEQCARELRLRVEKISSCCLGKRKTHKGYRFNYIEESHD